MKEKSRGGMKASVSMKGQVEIIVRDKDGNIKQKILITNTITTRGKNAVASAIASGSMSAWQYIGIGTSSGGITHVVSTTPSASGNQVTVSATFSGYSGTETIDTTWLLDTNSTNTTYAVASGSVSPTVNVDWGAGDSVTITWTITVN